MENVWFQNKWILIGFSQQKPFLLVNIFLLFIFITHSILLRFDLSLSKKIKPFKTKENYVKTKGIRKISRKNKRR